MNKYLLIALAVVLIAVAVPFVAARADDSTMPAVGQLAPIAASGSCSTSTPRT
ncbi:MAG: hypothetical protein ABSF75_12315 [Terracidiphilus sp.]